MKRPLVLCSILFIIGAFLGITISTNYLLIFPLASILAIIYKLIITGKHNYRLFLYGCILILIFNIGFFRGFDVRKQGLGDLYDYFDKKVALCGEVVYISGDRNFFDVEGIWIASDDSKNDINVKVRVFSYMKPEINIKDNIVVQGKLSKFAEMRFWGDIDKRNNYASQGIFGRLYAENIEVVGNYAGMFDVLKIGDSVRTAMSEKIDKLIGGQEGALLKGILTGDKDDLSDETMQSLSLSGLSHIAAVSGINISIFLAALSIFIGLGSRKKYFSSFLTIVAVLVYVVIVGDQPSVLRAGAMVIYSVVITELRLRNDSLNSLMFATMALILINPYLIFNIGFELSFFATLGIVIYTQFFRKSIFGVTFSVFLIITPVIAYYYNVITLSAFFTNILISLIVMVSLPLGYVMYFVPMLAGILKASMYIILFIANAFASMPLFTLQVASPDILFFVLYTILLYIIFALLKKMPKRRIYIACMVFVLFFGYRCVLNMPCTEVNFVSVGQGNAIHIKTKEGKNILIDSGEISGGNYPSAIRSYLIKRGIKSLDFIFITSYKNEHIGGTVDLVKNLDVKKVYLPENNQELKSDYIKDVLKTLEKVGTVYYNLGSVKIDDVNIDVLDYSGTKNRIVTAKIHCNGADFLIMGDGDNSHEKSLMDRFAQNVLKSDVLLMSNHGSDNASDEQFITEVSPKYIVASTNNKFSRGMPIGIDYPFQTSVSGTVKFKINEKGIFAVKTLRSREEEY